MKTRTIIALLLLSVLTACQDDMGDSIMSQTGITATINNEEGSATRAEMIDAPSQAMILKWTAGDAIGVFDADNSNTCFKAAAADISADSTVAVFRSGSSVPKAAFLAYYPYDAKASGSTSRLQLTMPQKQQYVSHHFKAEPDPQACIMVGSGYANSVSFRNVCAIIKISYVPRDSDVVTAVVFRDLSGQPVSGNFTVDVAADGTPTATFPTTGDSQTLTLDCGTGVSVSPTTITSFFMVVPAREYTKGFQLDFQLASGNTDVRSIARKAGKTLLRSMVYCVGDVSVVSKDDYELVFGEGGGVVLDADQVAMVQSVKAIGSFDGEGGYGKYYEMIVKKGMGLKQDMTVIINQLSEALPYGLAAKVVSIKDMGDSERVRLLQYANAESAFKLLRIGKQNAINADGTLNDDGMVPLDLTRYFQRFVPAEGMEGVTIENDAEGRLVITDKTWKPSYNATRASKSGTLKFPHFAINLKSTETDRVSIGATPSISAGVAASVHDGRIEYIGFSLTPSLTLDIGIEKTIELANFAETERVIGVLYFAPITLGPIVLVPEFKLSGFFNVKGLLKFSATWSYTLAFNVGATYQKALNSDAKWIFRCSNKCQGVPTIGSLLIPDFTASISLSTQMGAIVDVGLSFYGIIDFTLYTKLGMDFSATMGLGNGFLTLSPLCEGGAAVGILGVKPERKTLAQIDFDPWWSRQVYPIAIMLLWTEDTRNIIGKHLAIPVDSVNNITVSALMGGNLIEDNEISWYVTKRNKGEDEVIIHKQSAGIYPASSFLYNSDNTDELDVTTDLPKELFSDYDCTYSVYIYCKPPGAVYGQKAAKSPSCPLGRIEIRRERNVRGASRLQFPNGEYFIVRDDLGGAGVEPRAGEDEEGIFYFFDRYDRNDYWD